MGRIRNLAKTLLKPVLKPWLEHRYRKPRPFQYDGIEVMVHPEVFPPELTLSTRIFLDFIKPMDLNNQRVLELGCGSGIISLFANKKGAVVTATDINQTALEYLDKAAETNNLKVECVESNLFDQLQGQAFDLILINPPYYPKQPESIKEHAWFCGSDFEYFRALFEQLPEYLNAKNQTLMILSQDCDLSQIQGIAKQNGIEMKPVYNERKLGEVSTIYSLQTINA